MGKYTSAMGKVWEKYGESHDELMKYMKFQAPDSRVSDKAKATWHLLGMEFGAPQTLVLQNLCISGWANWYKLASLRYHHRTARLPTIYPRSCHNPQEPPLLEAPSLGHPSPNSS